MTIKNPSMFVRPRSQNVDAPYYAPERDFGIQGIRILAEVELLIVTGRIDSLIDDYVVKNQVPTREVAMEQFKQAGECLMRFMADAFAKEYTGPKVEDWPVAQKAISFTEAIAKVYAHPNQPAMQFLLSLIGRFSLDAFFYGERSYESVGQPMHQDYNEYMDYLSLILLHGPGEKAQSALLTSELQRIVRAMLSAGFTPGAIQASLDRMVAGELTESR